MASGAEPKYRAIAGELRAAILDGTYGPGAQLPGENHLMTQYGVARMTARQALAVLITEGLAVPRPGAGVYVREFRPIVRDGIGRLGSATWPSGRDVWSADAASRELRVDPIEVGRAEPPDNVRALLGLREDEQVVRRGRRFVLDGKPVLLSVSYLPASLVIEASPIWMPDTGPGGTYARLGDLGLAPARFREDLRSRMPSADESERLDLPPGTPVVEITRTAWTAEGIAIEVNEMTADAGSYIFRYDFDAAV